jgi:hypothetical protein
MIITPFATTLLGLCSQANRELSTAWRRADPGGLFMFRFGERIGRIIGPRRRLSVPGGMCYD